MLRCAYIVAWMSAVAPASATVLTIADDGTVAVRHAATSRPRILVEPVAPPDAIAQLVADASSKADLATELITAVAWVESRYRTTARSPKGAIGLMQLMPATAREVGVDPLDPAANLAGGAAYLRVLLDRFDGDLICAVAAYNAGPGAVARFGGVPPYPETRRYVAAVLARLAATLPSTR